MYEGKRYNNNVPFKILIREFIRTTRGAKVKTLTETVKRPGLEFAQIDDVATSDLTETLKGNILINSTIKLGSYLLGVYAVLHVASPLPGRTSVDDTLNVGSHHSILIVRFSKQKFLDRH